MVIHMNGKYSQKSWEKQSVWNLDNGWRATVEYGYYGDHVVRLDSPDRKTYWHCSNGIKDLPDFAHEWLQGGEYPGTGPDLTKMVRVKFVKVYGS